MDNHLILGLMAKYWTSGEVKTRLGASIGMFGAASIHQLFTSHLCRNLAHAADRRDLCITPPARKPQFQEMLADQEVLDCWQIVPQGEGGLGQRMSNWFARNLADNHSQAILIGADCPTIQASDIEKAHGLLASHDVVIGPALDGGYYLIGCKGPWNDRFASLFLDMPWSSPEVCQITCERIALAGLALRQLNAAEDVDTIVELKRLRQSLLKMARGNLHADKLLGPIERILDVASQHSSEPNSSEPNSGEPISSDPNFGEPNSGDPNSSEPVQ